MLPKEKIKSIILKHESIEKELASGSLDPKLYSNKSKEYSELNQIIEHAKKYLKFESEKRELEVIINDNKSDDDMRTLAKKELESLLISNNEQENRLKIFLLPKDSDDQKNAIVEIRAGTGGLEATLFCADLFKMYEKVCSKKKWLVEIINISKSDAGGFKEVIFSVTGNNIYSYLKYESGVHRVQRVPQTETQGRIHTSASTVAVLPLIDEIDQININPSDLRIDTYRASGAGGQHVKKTDSAVRITHLPTGTVSECQDGRSQHKNKAQAMSILYSKLLMHEQENQKKETDQERKNLVGTGDRSQRIRTYNFPQGRVTDHRINLTLYKLENIMEGNIEPLLDGLKKSSMD